MPKSKLKLADEPDASNKLNLQHKFVRSDITGPDGVVRAGWELWIDDHCYGKAESKHDLLESLNRLNAPPPSYHWRAIRDRKAAVAKRGG